MADISATVVTLNEEENIRDCLETLTWCDEIVVVDSHSDDRTVEIAQEYTDKIYTYERTGYGDPARKKALEEATGEWICMLDADELIPSELAETLRTQVENESCEVIFAPRKNFILGTWMDCAAWWPAYRPILYKKDTVELSEQVHDFLSFPEDTKKTRLPPNPDNAVIHFNYTDMTDFIDRTNRYTSIEAEQTEFSYLRLISQPLFEFFYRFVYRSGYKKGHKGFFLSIFMSMYRFLTMAKAWERQAIGDKEDIIRRYDKITDEILSDEAPAQRGRNGD